MKDSLNKNTGKQHLLSASIVMLSLLSATSSFAEDILPDDNISKELQQIEDQTISSVENDDESLPTDLSDDEDSHAKSEKSDLTTKKDSIEYLKANPKEFEQLLSGLLTSGNAESLKELLPVYEQYKNFDPSIVEWGNAIIKAKSGQLKEAISDYRKLNSAFPNVRIIHFQMAMALFYNRQYNAAKFEFEKLRSNATNEKDIKAINQYLDSISKRDEWDISANASYINDKNLTNAPPVGTVIGSGSSNLTYSTPHQSGKGFSYDLSADKKWLNDNRTFTALHLGTYGKYYWDNKNYNDLTSSVGGGIGFQNGITEFEIGPYFDKRWYAGGSGSDAKLKSYSDSLGIKANLRQWLGPKLRYNGVAKISDSRYDSEYSYNNGTSQLVANSFMYFVDQNQYLNTTFDWSKRDIQSKTDSYDKKGVRLGWGKTWGKGFSSNLTVGYGKRNYKDVDFSNIKRENKEYSAGLSLWNRGFSVYGLTPKLNVDYFKVKSNSAFEEYDKSNVSVEFTKTF